MKNTLHEAYVALLKNELIPALGCTEPIAVAYVAATARRILGMMPEHMVVKCSGNIIKNVKGVKVPNAGEMRGIEASAILGMIGGNPDLALEVLNAVREEDVIKTAQLLETGLCKTEKLNSDAPLHIVVEMTAGSQSVEVELRDGHTNIVRITKNGEVLLDHNDKAKDEDGNSRYYPRFTLEDILDFADQVDLDEIAPVLERQIQCNMQIAEEGLRNRYGANVGKTILAQDQDNVEVQAKAFAAAGSDARMSGCILPVVINSGSGNQGMTVSLPVICYAKYYQVPHEKLLRALLVSNLIAIYQKSALGTLSAFCGAVCAATGSGAGIAYMMDGRKEIIEKTIINTLANVAGIVCDGAKSSCAAKIASCVDAAIMGYKMALRGNTYHSGEGLVKSDLDGTIQTIMNMGRVGMHNTDQVILDLMIQS
ncbi:MAG: L-serine ammonia-lyase, iron-sulfur-dependent, subunit alpha [Clostridia bacterium]|nr:L-serine ammonia-lyase, iron-sulfur-dependent, subunit alpha [Clostridia bacterium]